MIKICNICKSFNKRTVLKNISFEIESGKITALIGANGSGKSTLIRLISTLYRQDSGTIYVDNINTLINAELIKSKIGVLLGGDVFLYDNLTAYENIAYFGKLHGMSNNDIKNKIDELTIMFKMEDYINKKVKNFSRGMKQKVAFSRTLIHSPSILLLDEPTTGLDLESIIVVHNFIRQCRELGNTILLSTHNISEIKLSDNYIFLKQGSVYKSGNTSEIKGINNIMQLFK